jgi:hypothetical protein
VGGYRAVRLAGKEVVEELTAGPLPVEYAQGVCEDWVSQHKVQHLSAPQAPWRMRAATQKHTDLMRNLGLPVPPSLTSGEACDQIGVFFAAKTLRKSGRRAL